MDNRMFIGFEAQRKQRIVIIESIALAALLFVASVWTAFEVGQAMATYECASVAPNAKLWMVSE